MKQLHYQLNQKIYQTTMIDSASSINAEYQGQGNYADRIVYPVLDVYFSPRVFKDRVDHRNLPMCAYNRKVESTNVAKIYDQPTPNRSDLREFKLRDGLIYQFSGMNIPSTGEELSRKPLGIKVLICVCMYNEGQTAINLTLNGIYDNLAHLEKQGITADEVGVVLMQDGILKLVENKLTRTYAKGEDSMVHFYRTLDEKQGKKRCKLEERINIILDETENLSRKGMDRSTAENRDFPVSIQKNIALLYQNLWKPSMTDNSGSTKDTSHYLKLFSCFKHTNGTKLSSHLWFFQGFCRYLQPEYIVLLDVGTKPESDAIGNLLNGFTDSNVGGVTGFMTVDSDMKSQESGSSKEEDGCFFQCLRNAFFSVQKAQEYEYIISHFFDKNAESALGFLHVLPGAWSAYRYKALMKSDRYQPNLLEHSYFKMLLNPNIEEKDYKEANMYLAEDRILSLGIYCQPGERYYLKYTPNAIAKTDPMKSHEDLMKQRRRWINSSMFAFLYVWKSYHYHASQSKHSGVDKYVRLNLAMLTSMLSLITTYFSPAIIFYILFTTILQISISTEFVFIIARVVSILFVCFYLVGVVGSLQGNVWITYARYISIAMGIFTYGLLGLVTYNIVDVYLNLSTTGVDFTNFAQMSVLVMILVNLGVFAFILFLHLFTHPLYVLKVILGQISYISYQGAYTMTMVIHAFCNIDDVSWGTKGSSGHSGSKKYDAEKIKFVGSWLFYNCLLAYVLIYIDIVIPNWTTGPNENRRIIIICIGFYSTAYFLLKSVLAIYHQLKWILSGCGRCSQICNQVIEQDRAERVKSYWSKSNLKYQHIAEN